MRYVQARDLTPGMVLFGYPGVEFRRPPVHTVVSVTEMETPDRYLIKSKEGLNSKNVHGSRVYIVQEEAHGERRLVPCLV